MPEMQKCRGCGTDVPVNAPFGHCPKCLLELGFGPVAEVVNVFPPPPPRGDRSFADYELLEQIGRGGMGIVYRARQKSLNRLVALKMIVHAETASPSAKVRFRREAEAAASLEHPDIVSTYEIGEHDGQPFFSMRLIEGSNLAKQMPVLALTSEADGKDKGTASKVRRREVQERSARLVAAIARAIHYAHQHGVVHRDLKPTNILIDLQGRPHVTDFGIAKVLTEESGLTRTSDVLGTPAYMAPEQAAGKPAAAGADIYSLGAILYELLTGQPPFRADTPMETLRRVVEEEPMHPTALNRQADKDLASICLKCLEKDPLRRYGSAEAVADDLERWLRHEPIRARTAGPLLRTNRWVRRNPAGAGLIAALCVALAVVLALFGKVYTEQEARREGFLVLQRDVSRDLDDLWTTTTQGYETIHAEKLAALRGDLRSRTRSDVRGLDLLFAVYTHQEPAKMLSMMSPILGSLEHSLTRSLSQPVHIDLRIYRHYDDAQKALVRGDVHFMRLGSSSYVEAKAVDPGVSLLVAQNGQVRGYIFANANAGIHSLPELKGKTIAWVDRSSTTGHYLAKLHLWRAGLTARDFRNEGTNYLDSHDRVAKAVAAREYDAGAGNASVVDDLMQQPGTKLVVLKEFRESMGLPWVAGRALAPAVANSIRAGLLAIQDKALLRALGNDTTGFVVARDSEFDSLRKAMREAQEFDGVE